MIPNGEIWHYLALSALLRGITFKTALPCLNCLHSFATEIKHESHKNVCENKNFCNVIIPSEDTKILEFNQCQKSDRGLYIIYADLQCSIEKIGGCKSNPES